MDFFSTVFQFVFDIRSIICLLLVLIYIALRVISHLVRNVNQFHCLKMILKYDVLHNVLTTIKEKDLTGKTASYSLTIPGNFRQKDANFIALRLTPGFFEGKIPPGYDLRYICSSKNNETKEIEVNYIITGQGPPVETKCETLVFK